MSVRYKDQIVAGVCDVVLTLSEYNRLTPSEKMNGTTYYIEDAPTNMTAGIALSATLPSASWSESAQTITNEAFLSNGFTYVVTPNGSDQEAYSSAKIYADNVTVDGSMTFHCGKTPTNDLTINILMMGVE